MAMNLPSYFICIFMKNTNQGCFNSNEPVNLYFPCSHSPVTVFRLSFVSFCFYLNQLVEKFHLFKTKFWIFTYSIICSAFTWTDFIMILEENEIYSRVQCMHQFACSSIFGSSFRKTSNDPEQSIAQIKHIRYSLSQFLTCERDFIRLLAFLVELFVECVS